jgi:hypothetical protein
MPLPERPGVEPQTAPCELHQGSCFWAFRPRGADGWSGWWHFAGTRKGWRVTGPVDRHGRQVDEELKIHRPEDAAALVPYLKPELTAIIEREGLV